MTGTNVKPWWTLSAFDTIWFAAFLTFFFWRYGWPSGLVDWLLNLGAACLGWFSMNLLHYWWKTR